MFYKEQLTVVLTYLGVVISITIYTMYAIPF